MNINLKIHNHSNVKNFENLANDFYKFAQQKLNFDKPVELHLISDLENFNNPLGKTAYYDPSNFTIIIYSDGRHVKDMLRSFSHELVHHKQNCENKFENDSETFEGYAQNNPHLRNIEKEAYLYGNMNFRDWEDNYKKSNDLIKEWTIKLSKNIVLLCENRV